MNTLICNLVASIITIPVITDTASMPMVNLAVAVVLWLLGIMYAIKE